MTHEPEIPAADELGRGALKLLQRHFEALNSGDLEAFRETVYLFDFVDGLPFERWWSGMRSLAPLSVALTPGSVTKKVTHGGRRSRRFLALSFGHLLPQQPDLRVRVLRTRRQDGRSRQK